MIPSRVQVAPDATLVGLLTDPEVLPWIDISERVRTRDGVSFRRGRSGQSDVSSAGSLSFALNNGDATFSPQRGNLAPWLRGLAAAQGVSVTVPDGIGLRDMPVRVLRRSGDSWVPLWAGVITGVRLAWEGGVAARVAVTAADAVAALNRTPMRQLPLQMALAYGAAWAYGLDEAESPASDAGPGTGASLALRPIGSGWTGSDFKWSDGRSPGSQDRAEHGAATWVAATATAGHALDSGIHATGDLPVIATTLAPPGAAATIHAALQPAPDARTMTAVALAGTTGVRVDIGVTATTQPYAAVIGGDGTSSLLVGQTVDAGSWHHVALTVRWAGLTTDLRLWADGVQVAQATHDGPISNVGDKQIRLGASLAPWVPQCWEGRVANVAGHDRVLLAGEIADLAGGIAGWSGEHSTQRGERIARAALRAPQLPSLSALGMSELCPQHTDGRTAGQALDEVAQAEQSGWWTLPSGQLRVGSRESRFGAPVAVTLPARVIDAGIDFAEDNDGRLTEIVAKRPGGAAAVRRSHDAGDGIVYSKTVELIVDSDPQLESYADWMIAPSHSEPLARSETVALDVFATAADIDVGAVLSLDIDDVLEVADLPPTAPADTLRLLIVGVADKITASGWGRTFNVIPADPFTDYWTLDVDLLDVGTVLAP